MTKIEEKDKVRMTSMKQSFINYFSVGLDARIGFGTIKIKKDLKSQGQRRDAVINAYTFGRHVRKAVAGKP
jgi:hypothetical protein